MGKIFLKISTLSLINTCQRNIISTDPSCWTVFLRGLTARLQQNCAKVYLSQALIGTQSALCCTVFDFFLYSFNWPSKFLYPFKATFLKKSSWRLSVLVKLEQDWVLLTVVNFALTIFVCFSTVLLILYLSTWSVTRLSTGLGLSTLYSGTCFFPSSA